MAGGEQVTEEGVPGLAEKVPASDCRIGATAHDDGCRAKQSSNTVLFMLLSSSVLNTSLSQTPTSLSSLQFGKGLNPAREGCRPTDLSLLFGHRDVLRGFGVLATEILALNGTFSSSCYVRCLGTSDKLSRDEPTHRGDIQSTQYITVHIPQRPHTSDEHTCDDILGHTCVPNKGLKLALKTQHNKTTRPPSSGGTSRTANHPLCH